jgi:DnaJ-class molecular chaperone
MRSKILALLMRTAPPKCERCAGSGIVTVDGPYWDRQPCWCGACNGTGIQREPRLLNFPSIAPSHTTNKEKD